MNRNKWYLLGAVFVVIAGAAVFLNRFKASEKLGSPGIKATPIPGSVMMKFDLPERVLDFTSTNVPTSKTVLDWLPKDTSYAQRYYMAPDGFYSNANIILMGTDKSSIHQADICLPGQGWHIEERDQVVIPVGGEVPFELKVAKWRLTAELEGKDGMKQRVSAVYVFWFVADGEQTANLKELWWLLARDLLAKQVLQRWAYVSYFTACNPGQEEMTFERMKQLIAASVPEFQLPQKPAKSAAVARN